MKIQWTDKPGRRPDLLVGYVAGLMVAEVWRSSEEGAGRGGWWVHMHIHPLPDALYRSTDRTKKTQAGAQASAQRIFNSYIKLMTTGAY